MHTCLQGKQPASEQSLEGGAAISLGALEGKGTTGGQYSWILPLAFHRMMGIMIFFSGCYELFDMLFNIFINTYLFFGSGFFTEQGRKHIETMRQTDF